MSTSIGDELKARLRDAVGSDNTTVGVEGDDISATIDVEHCERYAVGVRGIDVTSTSPSKDIRETAEGIARKVDVIEPLRVVEVDTREGQAILRSAEPEADEEGVTYWEATVKPRGTAINRYHKSHGEPDREIVVEPLSHREAGKLVDQVADAIRETSE
jgi:hypothetical protein